MGVIHEGAWPACHELVDKGLARWNLRLGESADTIHSAGQTLPVPMNGGVLRQAVGDEDAHPVAFDHFDRWAGALSVVTPQVGIHARSDLPHNRLGHKVKLLDALVHAPQQRPAVEGDHGSSFRMSSGSAAMATELTEAAATAPPVRPRLWMNARRDVIGCPFGSVIRTAGAGRGSARGGGQGGLADQGHL